MEIRNVNSLNFKGNSIIEKVKESKSISSLNSECQDSSTILENLGRAQVKINLSDSTKEEPLTYQSKRRLLSESNITAEDQIAQMLSCDDEHFIKALSWIPYGLEVKNAINCSYNSKQQPNHDLAYLINGGIDLSEIESLLELPNNRKKVRNLISNGVSPRVILLSLVNESAENKINNIINDETISDKSTIFNLINNAYSRYKTEKEINTAIQIGLMEPEYNLSMLPMEIGTIDTEILDRIHSCGIPLCKAFEYYTIPKERLNSILEILKNQKYVPKQFFDIGLFLKNSNETDWEKGLKYAMVDMPEGAKEYIISNIETNEDKEKFLSIQFVKQGLPFMQAKTFYEQFGEDNSIFLVDMARNGHDIEEVGKLLYSKYFQDEINSIIALSKESSLPIGVAKYIKGARNKDKALELYRQGVSGFSAAKYADMEIADNMRLPAAQMNGLGADNINLILSDEDEMNLACKFIENKIPMNNFHKTYKEDRSYLELLERIYTSGLNSVDINSLLYLKLDSKSLQNAFDLVQAGAKVNEIYYLANTSKLKDSLLYEKDLQNPNNPNGEGISHEQIKERVLRLHNESKLSFNECFNINGLYTIDEDTFNRFISFNRGTFSPYDSLSLAKMKNKEGEFLPESILKLSPLDVQTTKDLFTANLIDEDTINKAIEYRKRGLNAFYSVCLAQLNINEYDKAAELVKHRLPLHVIQDVLKHKKYAEAIYSSKTGAEAYEYSSKYNLPVWQDTKTIIDNIALSKKYGMDLISIMRIKEEIIDLPLDQKVIEAIFNAVKNGLEFDKIKEFARTEFIKNKTKQYEEIGIKNSDADFLAKNSYYDKNILNKNNMIIDTAMCNDIGIKYAIPLVMRKDEIKTYNELKDAPNYTKKLAAMVAVLDIQNSEKSIQILKGIIDPSFVENIKKGIQNPNLDKHIDRIFNQIISNPNMLKSMVNCELSLEEISELTIQYAKKSLKLAMKRPNLYLSNIPIELTTKTNGKYPDLSSEQMEQYQNQFCDLVSENLSIILRAQKYLDADTFNQLMDKRTDNFYNILEDLNKLTDENYKKLSDLCQLKNPENKPLRAKDKIELARIIYDLQLADIETDIFSNSGTIDIEKIKQDLLMLELLTAGITKEELMSVPPSKLDFDKEYTHAFLSSNVKQMFNQFIKELSEDEARQTIISELKSNQNNEFWLEHMGIDKNSCDKLILLIENIDNWSEDKLYSEYISIMRNRPENNDDLQNVLRGAILFDYKDFLMDETSPIGKVNCKTKEEFEKRGLDYDKWFYNSSIKDFEFKIKDRNLKIGLWERYPQKDLFMGDRTSCCTALSGGSNGASTPIYLLNSAFNVVEVKDDKDNIIAMSRIYTADIDDEPSLVMDNIEINGAFFKELNPDDVKKLRDVFFSYIKHYANNINLKNLMNVYFSTSYTHVPIDDLEKTKKNVNFIGEISAPQFYSNTAAKWISPSELKENDFDLYVIN